MADWRIAHLVHGDYICEKVMDLVRRALKEIVELAPFVSGNDERAVKAIMESLVLSGLCMQCTNSSRPASGAEHVVSHYWECKKLGGSTPPLRTKDGWLVIYHGVGTKDSIYRVGAMLLDIDNPEKIIARSSDYLMEPEFDYEMKGVYSGCVFPTGNVIVGDTLYLYYGGADIYCCVATCSVEELLEHLRNNKVE